MDGDTHQWDATSAASAALNVYRMRRCKADAALIDRSHPNDIDRSIHSLILYYSRFQTKWTRSL